MTKITRPETIKGMSEMDAATIPPWRARCYKPADTRSKYGTWFVWADNQMIDSADRVVATCEGENAEANAKLIEKVHEFRTACKASLSAMRWARTHLDGNRLELAKCIEDLCDVLGDDNYA